MTRKKTATPAVAAPGPMQVPTQAHAPASGQAPVKSVARQPFHATREERRSALTHAQIADDLAAFERDGGRIEVLGNTPMLRTIPLSQSPPPAGAQKHPAAGAPAAATDE